MTKTHEEHAKRVTERHGKNLEVVGRYRHSRTAVSYRCHEHGVFRTLPSSVEAGSGCPSCARQRQRLTHEEHVLAVRKAHGDSIRVIGTYAGSHKKIEYGCPKHGSFFAKPANVVHCRTGCRKCFLARSGKSSRKPHAAYVQETRDLGVTVLDRYVTALTPIRHRCAKGHVWSTSPNQILSGYGCPLCDQSQYRRRPIRVGKRTAWVQGSEGKALAILLSGGTDPDDLAFTTQEGKPTFRYSFCGRMRRYIPDFFIKSERLVVEVKSPTTLGLHDQHMFAQVRAKARSVVAAGYELLLMVIHRGQNIDLGSDWHRLPWGAMARRLRRIARAQDRRTRRT